MWDLFDKDTNIGAALIKMSVNVNSQVKHEVNQKPKFAGNINVLNKAELLAGTEMLTGNAQTYVCHCRQEFTLLYGHANISIHLRGKA